MLKAIVRGVYGMLAVLGVGGIPRISQLSFPLSLVGEPSLSSSSVTSVRSVSLGKRAQIVKPRLTRTMTLWIVSIHPQGQVGRKRGKGESLGATHSMITVAAKVPLACRHELCTLSFAATLQDFAIYQAVLLGWFGSRWSGPAWP